MGRIILFLLLIFGIFIFVMRAIGRFIAFFRGASGRPASSYHNRQRHNPSRKPETQEDRIVGYQRKSFMKDEAEDVEFEEVRD